MKPHKGSVIFQMTFFSYLHARKTVLVKSFKKRKEEMRMKLKVLLGLVSVLSSQPAHRL